MARICLITAGHLATSPRIVKAADALAAMHDVRVVHTRHTAWAADADERLQARARWRSTTVEYDRVAAPREYMVSGARQRASRLAIDVMSAGRVPAGVAVRALSRAHDELVAAASSEPADLYYGGTNGALAAAAAAAAEYRVPFGLDLEDFHSGEHIDDADNLIAERVERNVLQAARFLTTASDAQAAAYADKYGVQPIVVRNTFPLPEAPPDFTRADPSTLKLYWFSQTIGLDRGLQDAIRACGAAGIRAELGLRGRVSDAVRRELQALAHAVAPALTVTMLPPADPELMIDLCRGYDVGLSLEQPVALNRTLALGNKALTYPLAGLAIAFTDTLGQRPFAADLGRGALVYEPGDVVTLAAGLAGWAADPQELGDARRAAWHAASRRWHWEADRAALVAAVEAAL